MATFKIKVKRHSFLELEIHAEDKLSACIMAKTKAKSREGWGKNVYSIDRIEVL